MIRIRENSQLKMRESSNGIVTNSKTLIKGMYWIIITKVLLQ